MKNIVLTALGFYLALQTPLLADPQLTSWLTVHSGQYARIYGTTAERSSGTAATTWSHQSVPAYADISQVLYSSSWVYVRAADLPSYVSGPWLTPQGGTGQFSPTNQHILNRFPRKPTVQSGTKTISGTGYSGLYVDGIAVFNFTDGKAWNGTDIVSGPHNQSTYYWHRNAPAGEGYNFDYGLGHQNPSGVYHTHQQPIALRYQLGDHVDYNSSTKNYSESSSTNLSHSPIIGWAYDGYPIYGPYGYSISNNAASGVRRMVSGYVQRDGKNGTDNLTNNLSVIPAWYARFRQAHFGGSYSTVAGTPRPSVGGTNGLGTFAEDYSYYDDLTNPATGQLYAMGTNTFDLDVYNGRWCVTPEFPGGTYAYFLDISSNGTSAYPYAIAYEYYGTASGGSVGGITESVTTNFDGSADSALVITPPTVNSNYVVSLTWSSTEGGTYQIESSRDESTWTTQKSGVAAAADAVSTSMNYTSTVTSGTSYARVTRTALATYDPVGNESGLVAQTNVVSFSLGNTAPVVANPIPDQIATYGAPFSYTFDANTFTDADAGQTLTYSAASVGITNAGIFFNPATRTFSAAAVDAAGGGTITGDYAVAVIATDNGSPALSATNLFTLTINPAVASVTVSNASRVYGGNNPALGGNLSGFLAADNISAAYDCAAATNSSTGNYAILPAWSDPGARLGNYTVTTNGGLLTVTQAELTVTASNYSRAYGAANPLLSGIISGVTNDENITATYSTTATTNSPAGSYPVTVALNDPQSRLANYAVTASNGTLTVTNANARSNYQFTMLVTNRVVPLATNNGGDFSFTDPDSGLSVTVALTMMPLSASNASPVFKPLDFYGPAGSPVHASIDSGVNDGNWLDFFEQVQFAARLLTASPGINTNTIKFAIADLGIRPSSGTLSWTSTSDTNVFLPNAEALWPLDSGWSALADANYNGLLGFRTQDGQLQLSDTTGGATEAGIVFGVQFYEGTNAPAGTNATLASAAYANGQFYFAVSGTAGAGYIVQVSTNLASGTWTPLVTNIAPFTYTNAGTAGAQQFYRAVAQ